MCVPRGAEGSGRCVCRRRTPYDPLVLALSLSLLLAAADAPLATEAPPLFLVRQREELQAQLDAVVASQPTMRPAWITLGCGAATAGAGLGFEFVVGIAEFNAQNLQPLTASKRSSFDQLFLAGLVPLVAGGLGALVGAFWALWVHRQRQASDASVSSLQNRIDEVEARMNPPPPAPPANFHTPFVPRAPAPAPL